MNRATLQVVTERLHAGTTSAASRHKKAPDHKLTNQHVELTPGQRKSQQSNRQPPSATFKPRQPTPATPPSRSSDATECNQAADQAEADRACDTQEAEEDVSLLNVESPCRALASQPAVVCGSTMPEELSMQHLQEHGMLLLSLGLGDEQSYKPSCKCLGLYMHSRSYVYFVSCYILSDLCIWPSSSA